MAKVSIILPFYNSEKTIADCITSILAQDYTDFELILCDDGSEDQSFRICQKYAQLDKRVKLFQLPHAGVSAARNAGLSYSGGEYIMFADSDDYVQPNWVSYLVDHMSLKSLALCGYSCVNEEGERVYGAEARDGMVIENMEIESSQFIEDIFSNRHMYQGYIWNKIFDASLIKKHNIQFHENIAYNEDRLFLFNYLLFCQKVNYSNVPLYTYSLRTVGRKIYNESFFTEIEAFEIMCDKLQKYKMYSAYRYARADEMRAISELLLMACESRSQDAEKLLYLRNRLNKELRSNVA